jgi:hypothetical protein
MEQFKTYVAKRLVGTSLRFKCDCVFPMDIEGIIKDYEIVDGEIIFKVLTDNKIISIGLNHPKMMVKPL